MQMSFELSLRFDAISLTRLIRHTHLAIAEGFRGAFRQMPERKSKDLSYNVANNVALLVRIYDRGPRVSASP